MRYELGALLDHVHLRVANLEASRRFYLAALTALGHEVEAEAADHFAIGELYVSADAPATSGLHLAFQAGDRAAVDRFHAQAVAAGGEDHGAPGERSYGPGYYAAFVLDPDGNNIEAVHHEGHRRSARAIEVETAAVDESPSAVGEAQIQKSPTGVVRSTEGWFVVNARDARWSHAPGRTAVCEFDGEVPFAQVGVNLSALNPGEAMSRYHWEADQEDFIVLAGEALLIVEGKERRLKAWDFVHCPPGVSHVIVGAGKGRSIVLALGARDRSTGEAWGAYSVDPVADRHHASAEYETTDPSTAYSGLPRRQPTAFDPAWLPE